MIHPIDVAHVNINVTNLDRAEKFYTEILGLKVSGKYEGTIVWLNFGQHADSNGLAFHDVALYKVPEPAPTNRRTMAGMNHVALRLMTPEEVDAAASILKAHQVKILKGPGTHKEDGDRYLYFEDPDYNVIELVSNQIPYFLKIPGR